MSLGISHSIGYNNLNWFYQLSWWSKLATVKSFLSRCHTWQILFADSNRRIESPISGLSDIGDFIRLSRWSAKIAIAAPGTPGDFRPIAEIGVWNRRCVDDFELSFRALSPYSERNWTLYLLLNKLYIIWQHKLPAYSYFHSRHLVNNENEKVCYWNS